MSVKHIADETHEQRAQVICQIITNEFARFYEEEATQ
jgi:hypothetical protein